MSSAIHQRSSGRRHEGLCARRLLLLGVVLAAIGIAALPGVAWSAPLQRGDVLLAGSGGVQEYSPAGQLLQTVSVSSGAAQLCFNPNGTRLIVPGVGLFDSSGNLLPSHWAAVTAQRCVVDGSGNVFGANASYTSGGGWTNFTITKYDLTGNVIRTYVPLFYDGTTGPKGPPPFWLALAPDDCTMYFGDWGPSGAPLNVCTNTQASGNGVGLVDDLRVLPSWQLLAVTDNGWWGPSAQVGPVYLAGELRSMSLDPDNTSFWISGLGSPGPVFRFDINTGSQLSLWWVNDVSAIASFAPPLMGDADVKSNVDSNPAGTAEAFPAQAGYSGNMSRLHLYVDSTSTASQVVVGIYSDKNGRPFALQKQATITNLRAGSWNYVDVPSVPVTAGQRYWIAVLEPSGGGTIRFRDATGGGAAETAAQPNLTALPAHWSGAAHRNSSGPLSGYGS